MTNTRKIGLLVLFMVMCIMVMSLFVNQHPLSKNIQIEFGKEINAEFFVLFPGKYTIALVFDRSTERSYTILQEKLGDFGCRNTLENTSCGSFENYEVSWAIEKKGKTIILGKATPQLVAGGWLSRNEWAEGIGIVDLPFGKQKLSCVPISGLSSLNNLNPRLVVSPGHGAKSLQSAFAVGLVLAGVVCLYFILPILFVVVFGFWLLKRLKRNLHNNANSAVAKSRTAD